MDLIIKVLKEFYHIEATRYNDGLVIHDSMDNPFSIYAVATFGEGPLGLDDVIKLINTFVIIKKHLIKLEVDASSGCITELVKRVLNLNLRKGTNISAATQEVAKDWFNTQYKNQLRKANIKYEGHNTFIVLDPKVLDLPYIKDAMEDGYLMHFEMEFEKHILISICSTETIDDYIKTLANAIGGEI